MFSRLSVVFQKEAQSTKRENEIKSNDGAQSSSGHCVVLPNGAQFTNQENKIRRNEKLIFFPKRNFSSTRIGEASIYHMISLCSVS